MRLRLHYMPELLQHQTTTCILFTFNFSTFALKILKLASVWILVIFVLCEYDSCIILLIQKKKKKKYGKIVWNAWRRRRHLEQPRNLRLGTTIGAGMGRFLWWVSENVLRSCNVCWLFVLRSCNVCWLFVLRSCNVCWLFLWFLWRLNHGVQMKLNT